MPERPSKTCASCGRVMEWRAGWARNWESVRYCSERCRRRRPKAQDRELERIILALLDERPVGATICPSEAARALGGEWRERMETARAAARRLVAAGDVVITQRGQVVDPSTAKGPIRIRRFADTRLRDADDR